MIAFLILMLVAIPLTLLRGLVLSDLIGWFTPFHVGVVQAIGISIIATLFTFHLKKKNYAREEGDNTANAAGLLISGLLTTLICWFFGYIWSLFL